MEEKDKGVGLRCGEGSRSAWKTLNGTIWSIFCALYKVQARVSLASFGLVQSSSVHSTELLLGAADAWQMARQCGVRFQLIFFFSSWLSFSSNMIVSSLVHTWQNKARSCKVSWDSDCLCCFTFFLPAVSFQKDKDKRVLKMFYRNQNETDDRKIKSVQTSALQFQDMASASTTQKHSTLYVGFFFFIVFVRAHTHRQTHSYCHSCIMNLDPCYIWTCK